MLVVYLLNSIKHGGAENVAFNYAKVMKRMHISSVFIGKPASEEYAQKISEIGTIKYHVSGKILRDADIILVHSNLNLLKVLLFRILPLKWKRKKVIYLQHLLYSERKFKILALLINTICTDFIQITPITNTLVHKYIKTNINFIVNFYLNNYSENEWPKIRKEVRNELNIDNDHLLVTFSSILKPGKNISEFISLAKTSTNLTNISFLVLGDGVEANVVRNYDGNNLIWLGFVNDVERYLIASDIFVFLSKQEMMPMALVEAINTNKYILCYNTIVNNFLVNGSTYDVITKNTLSLKNLPNGKNLTHYDESYAIMKLSKLILQ